MELAQARKQGLPQLENGDWLKRSEAEMCLSQFFKAPGELNQLSRPQEAMTGTCIPSLLFQKLGTRNPFRLGGI